MVLASELLRVADPRFSLVTITSVVVSSDLRYAKVYWIATGGKERLPEVEEAFAAAEGLLKRALGAELGIRFVPALRFFYDDTYDTCEEVERLLERVRNGERH